MLNNGSLRGMTLRLTLLICAGFFTVVGVVACASESPGASPRLETGTQHLIAHPPVRPCLYPGANEIASLSEESDLVVEASVTGPSRKLVSSSRSINTQFSLEGVHVVGAKVGFFSADPKTLTIREPGDASGPLLLPGRYLLFLRQLMPTTDFYVVEGMGGAIRQDGVRAIRTCPNYDAPSQRLQATSPTSLQDLKALVPSVLPPRPAMDK